MPVHEVHCKGKMNDEKQCPLMVSYEPEPIPGVLKMEVKIGADEKEVVYLTCENGHTCRYEF